MTTFEISEKTEGDFDVLFLSGDVIFGEANGKLRLAIRNLLAVDKNCIAIDLSGVDYIDSSGIGELISALTAVTRKIDGKFKLQNPAKRIQKLLEIAKLNQIFEIEFTGK